MAKKEMMAINACALAIRNNKLHLGEFHLLSLITNLIHRQLTGKYTPVPHRDTVGGVISAFLGNLLQQGAATLFFTLPASGPVYQLWQQAKAWREQDFARLREVLALNPDGAPPKDFAQGLENAFALPEPAAIGARYPLGTYMCQVIQSAFGRSRLVDLFRQPARFVSEFEQAREKFRLPEKYSLGGGYW